MTDDRAESLKAYSVIPLEWHVLGLKHGHKYAHANSILGTYKITSFPTEDRKGMTFQVDEPYGTQPSAVIGSFQTFDEAKLCAENHYIGKIRSAVSLQPPALDAERGCSCHPDDSPPNPCAKKYALTDCKLDRSEALEAFDKLCKDENVHFQSAHHLFARWCHDYRNVIKSALSGPAWRPIETAPMDGTTILISDGTDTEVCFWRTYRNGIGEWQGTYYDGYDFEYIHGSKPTHWQPLPTAPSSEDGGV